MQEIDMKKACDGRFLDMDSIFSSTDQMKVEGLEKAKTPSVEEETVFSDFSEIDCGEPMTTQYLRIDFTPNAEDNEIQRQKCFDFWQFIESVPELQRLKVYPQNKKPEEPQAASKAPSEASQTFDKSSDNKPLDVKDTVSKVDAVHTLKLMQDKGMIDRSLEFQMPQVYCTPTSSRDKEVEATQKKNKKKRRSGPCPCVQAHRICKCELLKKADEVSSLKTIIKEMQEWDDKHPRSMDPPGRTPIQQHCVLQDGTHLRQK